MEWVVQGLKSWTIDFVPRNLFDEIQPPNRCLVYTRTILSHSCATPDGKALWFIWRIMIMTSMSSTLEVGLPVLNVASEDLQVAVPTTAVAS